jgi:hypothetical protein
MPSGGKRAGAGRKFGSLNKRHKVVVEDPTALLPIDWMLAVLRDPEAEQSRRDQMAVQAAPYLHAKLNAVAVSSTNGNGGGNGGDINLVQIFAVPRGARVDVKDGSVMTIDGEVTELKPIEPYQPTPPLELTDQSEQPAPIEPPLPVLEVDTSNVTVLRRRDDDDPGPGAA